MMILLVEGVGDPVCEDLYGCCRKTWDREGGVLTKGGCV
jgi:hypothetical protein